MIARVPVLASRAETPTTHVLRIARPDGFDFQPVQFVGLEFVTDDGPIEYPMSMASSPTRPYIEFGARVTSGSPWKRAFQALTPGDEVEVDGPYGHFVLDTSRSAVFIAGGIGITPIRGMMQYIADTQSGLEARLVYSNRSPEEIAFRDELDGLAARRPNPAVFHTMTGEASSWDGRRGRIDAPLIAEAAHGLASPVFYVCGLPAMVRAVQRMLDALGVPDDDRVVEGFHGYA